jgi:hypothetical protein
MYYANSCVAGMHRPGERCTELIEETAKGLSESAALMLLAVQKDNLELNIKEAVRRSVPTYNENRMSQA